MLKTIVEQNAKALIILLAFVLYSLLASFTKLDVDWDTLIKTAGLSGLVWAVPNKTSDN